MWDRQSCLSTLDHVGRPTPGRPSSLGIRSSGRLAGPWLDALIFLTHIHYNRLTIHPVPPMKLVFAVLLLIASAAAQATRSNPQSACGPLDTEFKVKTFAAQHTSQPEPDKALVYVIEDFRRAPNELTNPTIRIGLDGSWIGATRNKSYISFSVATGEHHLCTSWQSQYEWVSKLKSFARLNAEAGQTYYYRARITYAGSSSLARRWISTWSRSIPTKRNTSFPPTE